VLHADLERGRERLLEVLDRLLGPAEQELETAKVVVQPADVALFGERLVLRLRLLGASPSARGLCIASASSSACSTSSRAAS
jgi:hypothetical protein